MMRQGIYAEIGAMLRGNDADTAVAQFTAAFAKRCRSKRVTVFTMGEKRKEGAVRDLLRAAGGKRLADRAEILSHESEDLDGLLRAAAGVELDLLIVGRRLPASALASTSFPQRVARKMPCSVLLVTPDNEVRFDRFLVPIDFSEHSARAVRAALDLAGTEGKPQPVWCHHVASIPYGFSYTGDSAEAFAAERVRHLEEEFASFQRDYRLPRSRTRLCSTISESPGEAVIQIALAKRSDMIVVGSRGKTKAAAILLGSTAEDLVERSSAPLLIAKEKGETLGFLKALFGL